MSKPTFGPPLCRPLVSVCYDQCDGISCSPYSNFFFFFLFSFVSFITTTISNGSTVVWNRREWGVAKWGVEWGGAKWRVESGVVKWGEEWGGVCSGVWPSRE